MKRIPPDRFLFSIPTSLQLARKIAKLAKLRLGKVDLNQFADGEIYLRLLESVADQQIYVLGSTHPPAENWLGLLILIHTLKQSGAKKVSVIIPYFGYARTTEAKSPGEALGGRLMAHLIAASGADSVLTIDLHSEGLLNFFTIPVNEISTLNDLATAASSYERERRPPMAVISPDAGGLPRAKQVAKFLNITDLVRIEKIRPVSDQVQVKSLKGHVQGKTCLIVDDLISTGQTIIKAAEELKSHGAKQIDVCASHLLYSAEGWKLLANDHNLRKIYITDTVPAQGVNLPKKFVVVSVAPLIAGYLLPKLPDG